MHPTNFTFYKTVLILLLSGYFVLALLPITNADSLDYHVGVALSILNNGVMPVTPEWFHSRLAGSGEVLNALGFSVGAEQFGSLLQYSGLLAIVGIIVYLPQTLFKDFKINEWPIFVSISAISSPVLIFLISSVKPQMLPIAMTTSALTFVIYTYFIKNNKSSYDDLKYFTIGCLLVMTASQMKFSYLLGGGVVGVSALWLMWSRDRLKIAMAIGMLSFIVIMLPRVLWQSYNFDASYLIALITPFPGEHLGIANFEEGLRSYRDSQLLFPFSLMFPDRIGNFTTIIGAGMLLLFYLNLKNSSVVKFIFALSIVVFVLALLLGPPTSRSYLEPFFWLMIAISLHHREPFNNKIFILIKSSVFIQLVFVGFAFLYSIVMFGSGIVSASSRVDIMSKHANGYKLMQWVDSVLPKNAVLLSSHRSKGLAPRKVVSLDWLEHVEQNDEGAGVKYYMNLIKNKGVSHILFQGKQYRYSFLFHLFEKCTTDIIGPGIAQTATRNPFNQGVEYDVWMVGINYNKKLCNL